MESNMAAPVLLILLLSPSLLLSLPLHPEEKEHEKFLWVSRVSVWLCLTSLHFSLDNVKSDLSSYVQNINLVGTDNNGLLLALPDKSRIPASWNISLVSDDQFNRATVANLMLIGAGKSELVSLITDITGLPCRALSDFISVRHPAKVLMLNHLCLWQLLTLSNLNIFSRLSVVLSAKGSFPKSDHTTGERSE